MTTEIEIVEGMIWTVAADAGALVIFGNSEDEQRAPAVTVPLADAVTPARVRRPLRYTWPAQAGAFGGVAVWLVLSLFGVLDGVLVAGIMDAPRVAWLVAGLALAVAMMATIEPHAGSEHSAYAAQCTPSRNTITGRFQR